MKTIAILMTSTILLAGCAESLGPFLAAVGQDPQKAIDAEDKVMRTVVKPVFPYCAGAPIAIRERLRQRLNDELALWGHQVGIYCAGDPPLTLYAEPLPPPAPPAAPVPEPAPVSQ